MNWNSAKNLDENNYELPGDWLKIEYFEALNILFRVENSLRIFVYIILKNEFKDKWKDLAVTSDDSETSTIGAIAKKRVAQDKNFAYLGYVMTSPLLHLTSGELIRIITSESYWKLFKNYFPGSKEIIKNKLDEIGNVRNSLAHFRPIKKGDIELVKQNSIHTLSEIEKTMHDFLNCRDTVPTNTDDIWYKELITIGIDECKISFKQSKKGEWIKLQLKFTPPIISKVRGWPGYSARTFNLRVDNMLTLFKDLTSSCISVNEINPSAYTPNPETHVISKFVEFTFSLKSIDKNYASIKADLENILLKIAQEIALIKEDNLARGKLIEVVSCTYRKVPDSEYYDMKGGEFSTELEENSPVEFWGSLGYYFSDFISRADKYPWMPVEVSHDNSSLPF